MRVLIVEDDVTLSQRLKTSLEEAGFIADIADNGHDAEWLGEEKQYQAAILDLGLPGQSGMTVLKQWRKKGGAMPVLILTARNAWHERVDGFNAGADDYLGKPFHMDELVARLRALVRRSQTGQQETVRAGGLSLDELKQHVIDDQGQQHHLTGMEFRLLRCLMQRPNVIFSKNALFDQVYDYDTDNTLNIIEVYVNRLRKKLGKKRILTRRGQGYLFNAEMA